MFLVRLLILYSQVGYKVIWPRIILSVRQCEQLQGLIIDELPEYVKHLDSNIWTHQTMRMSYCDKATKDGYPGGRPYLPHYIFTDNGKPMDRASYALRTGVPSLKVCLLVMQLTCMRLFVGEVFKKPASAQDYASETKGALLELKARASRNWRAAREAVPATGFIDLGDETRFDIKEAMKHYGRGRNLDESLENLVSYMNRYYGKLTNLAKNLFVCKIHTASEGNAIIMKEQSHFLGLNQQHSVLVREAQGRTAAKEDTISRVFLNHPASKTYFKTCFNPTPLGCSEHNARTPDPGDLNLFHQSAMISLEACEQYMDEDYSLITDHIKNVWAQGDQECYEYMICWMASILQKPWRKLHASLILQGVEGTGKSMVLDAYGKWFLGPYYGKITRMSDVTGRFNSLLANKLLIVIEEAKWTSADLDSFKSLITDYTLPIERKGQDTNVSDNFLNIVQLTNNTAVFGTQARRCACFGMCADVVAISLLTYR